jgi:hypothetical protein
MKKVIFGLAIVGLAIITTPQVGQTGDPKVFVCHVPPGDPGNAHVISVGSSAVNAHVNDPGHSGTFTSGPFAGQTVQDYVTDATGTAGCLNAAPQEGGSGVCACNLPLL